MAQAALVDQDIERGRRLIQALDQAGFPVVAALWYFFPEEEIWRLLIASPRVSELGPRDAYALIQDVLLKSQIDLPFYSISAVSPGEPLITELQFFAGTDPAPFIGGTYLRNVVIGDITIDRAYVYRAERIVGATGDFEVWTVTPDRTRIVWTARRGKVFVEDGFIKKVEVQGFDWPQTHAKNGVNVHLGVLVNAENRHGETFGDVQRWSILGGRLRSVETVARDARIEGYHDAPSPTGVGK